MFAWRRGRAIVVDRKARDRGGLLDPDEVANTGTRTNRARDSVNHTTVRNGEFLRQVTWSRSSAQSAHHSSLEAD